MKNGKNNEFANTDIINITPISTSIFNKTNKIPNNKELFYYDHTSRRIIHITKEEIAISNKRANNILMNAKILLPIDKTEVIIIEPNLHYALITIQKKASDKTLLIINLTTQTFISILQDDYSNLLGMIFLSPTHLSNNTQQFFFCLIFKNKLLIKVIDNQCEIIYYMNEISYSNSSFIEQYLYNKTYQILCCCKSNNTFDFYNCSNESYMIKAFNIKQITFKGIKSEDLNKGKYEKTQFFLESLNNELFFIIFDIKQSKVLLYQLKNLDNIFNDMAIALYNNKIQKGTLCFVNNLIIVINFINWRIDIISIHSLSMYKIISSFIYSNPLGLDCNSLVTKGGNVIQIKSTLYYIDFDCQVYYDSFPYKLKQDALMTLIERKGSKEIVMKSIREMIVLKVKINRVFLLIKSIADQVYKGDNPPNSLVLKNKQKNASDLIISFEYIIKHHKRLMKQSDGFYLFKALENTSNIELDLLKYIIIFICLIHSYKIKIQPNFSQMINGIFQRIPIHQSISFLARNHYLDNKDTAIYLLTISQDNIKNCNRKIIRQIALDMLIRLKQKEFIFDYLLNEGNFIDALTFYTNHWKSISSSVLKEGLLKHVNANNRKIFLQYISK